VFLDHYYYYYYYFDVLILKIIFKNKKYYFNIFVNIKYFKKQLQLFSPSHAMSTLPCPSWPVQKVIFYFISKICIGFPELMQVNLECDQLINYISDILLRQPSHDGLQSLLHNVDS
jgi:hypothetical protein